MIFLFFGILINPPSLIHEPCRARTGSSKQTRRFSLVTNNLESLATILHEARKAAKPIPQISKNLSSLTRDDAYSIQEKQWQFRQAAGESLVGWKMGLTSEAKRRQMNLDSPLYGFLTDRMEVKNGGVFSLAQSIHPKIEPEIAFLLSRDLQGSVTRAQVLESCAGVASCMEILDSRYDQFKYFSMEDVIADNSSSSHFVVGEWKKDFRDLDLRHLQMKMSVNGELTQAGISSDISGDPVISVIELCEMLFQRGQILKAGSVVLAGAATTAVELKPGMKVKLEVDGLADVVLSVGGMR